MEPLKYECDNTYKGKSSLHNKLSHHIDFDLIFALRLKVKQQALFTYILFCTLYINNHNKIYYDD